MTRPTGRPPARQTTTIDVNHLPTSSDMENMSPGDGSISMADVSTVDLELDLSLDSVFNSIGLQHTHPTLSGEVDDIDLYSFSQQSTSPHGSTPPTTEIPQYAQTDIDSSSQSTTSPYQFYNSLLISRAVPTDLGLLAYNTDCVEILLSKLHLELCNQLLYVQSAPWDVQDALRLTMSPESSDSHDGKIGKENPLVPVAKASRELERLLVSLQPSTGPTESTPLTMPDHSRPTSLRTTQLLAALSCYIQITSIYYTIFTTVIEYFANDGFPTPLTCASSLHETSTRTLYLGGLPILPNWKLCCIMLGHQIEYQLEQIEMLIGLPEHYRISSKHGDDGKDVVTGLFAGQQSQSLLNAVFQLAEHTRCVRALKSKMRQLKEL
ncbi:hypothetical protein NOR_07388 [Metarhizium rileyi]|uniref:Uncharacterized protein n=1 Tax=Metarhizium rileyi (strain RCEF 4871) TaxID=1649241 RepID=A0A166YG33_METRR|nr:hypothetical protein NOR_07388 [Metarhizium rileyi RCEF 4871]